MSPSLRYSWNRKLKKWPDHALAKSNLTLRPQFIDTRLTGDFLAVPLTTGRYYIFESTTGRDVFVLHYSGFGAEAINDLRGSEWTT